MVLTSVQCWMSKFLSALLLQSFALLQLGVTKRDAEKSKSVCVNLTELPGLWWGFSRINNIFGMKQSIKQKKAA